MSKKHLEPEEVFVKYISKLIRNLFIKNKNFTNGYYFSHTKCAFSACQEKCTSELIRNIQNSAEYILEQIDYTKHLVNVEDDNG